MRGPRRVVALACAVVALLAAVADAQSSRTVKDAAVRAKIMENLELSLELQRRALEELAEPSRAAPIVYKSYVRLRAAHSDLEKHLRAAKHPDPLETAASPRLNDARMHVLRAQTALKHPQNVPKGRYAEVAQENLNKAMALIQGVMSMGL